MGSVDDFFNTLQTYNENLIPMFMITFVLGVIAVFLAFRKGKYSDKFISAILGFLWLWSGFVFFILFFGSVDVVIFGFTLPGMWYFSGVLFVAQGILILLFGVIKSSLSFRFIRDWHCFIGVVLVVYSMAIYPIVGFLTGFIYPRYPVFGIAPCPVTIFTLGLLQWLDKKTSILIAIIPFIWAVLGFMPVLVYSVWADVGLFLSGIIGFPLILMRNRKSP
jgi:hypothetical protein